MATSTRDLSVPELEALLVLRQGMASKSVRTVNDPDHGLRSVRGREGRALVSLGLAAWVESWGAFQITEAGRVLPDTPPAAT